MRLYKKRERRGFTMKKDFMKNLQSFAILAVIVIALFVTVTSIYVALISKRLTHESNQQLMETTLQGSKHVNYAIATDLLGLEMLAINFEIDGVQEPNQEAVDKTVAQLKTLVKNGSFISVAVSGTDGYALTDSGTRVDFSKTEGFFVAMQGKKFVSCKNEINVNEKRIVFDVPIYDKRTGEVKGVISGLKDVSNLAAVLDISTTGDATAYIVESNGNFIAIATTSDIDRSVSSVLEFIEQGNNSVATKNTLEAGFAGNEPFVGKIFSRGEDKFLTCTPIANSTGWFYMTVVPTASVHEQISYFLILTVFLLIVFLAGLVLILMFILRSKNKHTKEMTELAHIDQLTGISNWNKFRIDCDEILSNSSKQRRAIISIDIDGFKVFNDIYGHQEGNKVLISIAQQLERFTMLGERCSRYSGDTFLALVKFNSDSDILNWVTSFKKEVLAQFENYPLTLCFGIYKIGTKKYELDIMCDRANLARRTSKGNHETFYAFYHDETRRHIIEVKEIENDMNMALDNNQYIVYFQPKHSFSDEKIIGAEALARWAHPTKGMVFPDTFIPVFERNGFLIHLDMYILKETCKLIKSWIDAGIEPVTISVNMSQIHLKDPSFIHKLTAITDDFGVNPKYIEIELTESAIFENMESFTKTVASLKKSGFTVSMDDFGSGYSSLNLLSELQVDVLKIDRMFLSKSSDTVRGKFIIESVINMAKNLGITTVCEGVETEAQAVFLKNAGCDIAQGYYYSRPLAQDSFETYFSTHR